MQSPARSEIPSWRPDLHLLWRAQTASAVTRPTACAASGITRRLEMFGPPGAGKTTVALAVAEALARAGIQFRMHLSARAGEAPGVAHRTTHVDKLASALAAVAGRREPVADALLRLMPLPGPLASLRRRRYLAGLALKYPECLVLQDQGYLCAIAGLALDSGRDDGATLRRALELSPLPEIAVRVVVPEAITEARLRQRLAGMGSAARRLERPPADNRRLQAVFDRLEAELVVRGHPALQVAGSNPDDLAAAADAVVAAVLASATGTVAGTGQ
jgi:hypothetical protein